MASSTSEGDLVSEGYLYVNVSTGVAYVLPKPPIDRIPALVSFGQVRQYPMNPAPSQQVSALMAAIAPESAKLQAGASMPEASAVWVLDESGTEADLAITQLVRDYNAANPLPEPEPQVELDLAPST